jgi:hypothetical protein
LNLALALLLVNQVGAIKVNGENQTLTYSRTSTNANFVENEGDDVVDLLDNFESLVSTSGEVTGPGSLSIKDFEIPAAVANSNSLEGDGGSLAYTRTCDN